MRKTLSSCTFSMFPSAMLRGNGEDRSAAAQVLPAGLCVRVLLTRGDHKILVQDILTGRGYALVEAQDLSKEMPDPPGTPSLFRTAHTIVEAASGTVTPVQTSIPKMIPFSRPIFTPSKWPMEPTVPPPKPSKPAVIEPGVRLVHLEG